MSENQSLPTSSNSPLVNSTDNTNGVQETSQSDVDSSTDDQTKDWEIATLPGTIDSVQLERNTSNRQAVNETILSEAIAPGREEELLALIHDLNQCNDVLLARVTQLESALEQSQVAQVSHNAHQQIAKLVSKLDNTEQALNRQLLVNENLQTEVSNYQERISQLERECTIVSQRHLEEVQARAQAESASKDLRSRLQRQQRYTMQFKAALEKSLTVTARPSDAAINQPIVFKDATAGVMPKAQRIMPWVSDNSSPFAGIDPHLESLIRGMGKSDAQTDETDEMIAQKEAATQDERSSQNSANQNFSISSVSSSVSGSIARTTHLDAEAKLWQDLERVMGHSERGNSADAIEQTIDITSDIASDNLSNDPINEASVIMGQQSAETAGLKIAAQADDEGMKTDRISQKHLLEGNDLIHQIESSFAAANRNAPEEVIGFTEPSPWGKPLLGKQLAKQSEQQSDKKLERLANGKKTQPVSGSAEDSYLPTVDSQGNSGVVPVNPMRSPKQPGSLSNIELPTFRNAKVASFRR